MAKQGNDGAKLAAVLDEHLGAEFEHHDLERTMATMARRPYLHHVPVLTGAVGREGGAPLLRAGLHPRMAV